MFDWWIPTAQMSLAASAAVFGIVLLVTAGKTRLTWILASLAFAASLATLVHFWHIKIPGWPAFVISVMIWVNGYSVFKHRTALSASIRRSVEARKFGRRYDD